MTRDDRVAIVYLQAVPGENLHAKPLGTKTWRKPGQINGNYTCRKEKEEKRREKKKEERHGKENKEIKESKVLWRRIMSAVQIRVSTAGQYSTRYLASQCRSAEYYPQEIKRMTDVLLCLNIAGFTSQ